MRPTPPKKKNFFPLALVTIKTNLLAFPALRASFQQVEVEAASHKAAYNLTFGHSLFINKGHLASFS